MGVCAFFPQRSQCSTLRRNLSQVKPQHQHGRRRDFVKHLEEGRRGVRPKKSGHQQGRTERAPPRIHQRMEEAEIEGRGGAEASEGETDEEEGNPGRAREEIESGEEVRRREVEEDRGRKASRVGGAEEEGNGRGREEKTGGK